MFVPAVIEKAGPCDAARPLHIVHGVQSLDVGGLERIVVDLIRVGRKRGHRVSVVCLESTGTLGPTAEEFGATVACLDKPPGRTPELVGRATELFRKLRPDILHTHTVGALWYLGAAADAVGSIPVIHTEHTDSVGRARGWLSKLKTRVLWHRAARFADRFCCVSEYVKHSAGRWRTVPKEKLETVLNGIDTERFVDQSSRDLVRHELGIPTSSRVIGTVGRLNEVKRQDLLLRAFAALNTPSCDTHLLLIGDGPERRRLELLTLNLGVGNRVHFAGYQPEPHRFLAAMDVFALTSRLEGLPLALLEAMAAGLPVVSSAVGGVPKVIRDWESGRLFPSGDSASLTAVLRDLLANPAATSAMAVAGSRIVRERYSLDRMAADYEGRYRDLLGRAEAG